MAVVNVICLQDSYLDENTPTFNRSTINRVRLQIGGTREKNPIWRFDVTAVARKSWATVKLRLVYHDNSPAIGGGNTVYLSYINQPVVVNSESNWNRYRAPFDNWNTAGAQDSVDNDHTTRVAWPISGAHLNGDIIESPDLSALVQKAIDENGNILNLIMYGEGTDENEQFWDSLETSLPQFPGELFFTLVVVAKCSQPRFRCRPPLKRTPQGIGNEP